MVGRKRDDAELAACLELLADNAAVPDASGVLAILAGLSQGLSESGTSLRQMRAENSTPPSPDQEKPAQPMTASLAGLPKLLERAQQVSLESATSIAERLHAITALSHCGTAADPAELVARFWLSSSRRHCPARRPLPGPFGRCAAGRATVCRLERLHHRHAPRVGIASLRSPVTTAALLAELESKTIVPLELDAAVRDLLVRLPDDTLRDRAGKVLASAVPADRLRVLEQYGGAIALAADRQHGGRLVAQHCLVCHQIQGRGRRLGPDLSGIGSQPKQQLLVSLLDPSRQVSPDFLAYTLVTGDGQVLSGLLANETPHSVTLRRADAADEIVPRENIELLKASGKSLMPDGFEQKLSPQDVADLLDFLVRPDAALLVAPDAKPGEAAK